MNAHMSLFLMLFLIVQVALIWPVRAFAFTSPLVKVPAPGLLRGQPYVASPSPIPKATTVIVYQSEKAMDSSSDSDKKTLSDILSSAKDFQSNIDIEKITQSISQSFSAIQVNIQDGELGSRGEIYFVLQAALVLCILFGTIPFVGDIVSFIFGPMLVLLGGAVAALGVAELGPNLTPWPSPPKDGALITDSFIFNEVRHPIYAGLLYLMFGLSMLSGSAMRVLLCGALWYLLDYKTDLEEEQLTEKFGSEYILYKEKVTGKFIPQRLTKGIENLTMMID